MAPAALTHAGRPAGMEGGFTRMFQRRGPALGEPVLIALASLMRDQRLADPRDGSLPPAGYTYLAQFIDHDLVADPRTFRQPAGAQLLSERTPRFDLDSLYGGGPSLDPSLYSGGAKLRLNGRDLFRNDDQEAVIKDKRNDSNLLLSQMHAAFAAFHNRIVDDLKEFDASRLATCRHYQWVVLHDFLPMLVGNRTLDVILGKSRTGPASLWCFRPGTWGSMPLEFSAAAFRFGHSMVRSGYQLQAGGDKLHLFVGDAGAAAGMLDLRGFKAVPAKHQVDWHRFFPMEGKPAPQGARRIDTQIVSALFSLPMEISNTVDPLGRSLPFRNLYRGEVDLGLPTGQDVVRAMRALRVPHSADFRLGVEDPLVVPASVSMGNVAGRGVSVTELNDTLNQKAPLWYYVLAEAECNKSDGLLGPVGGQIVAETFIGLLLNDPHSILNTGWRPTPGLYGCRADGRFCAADLMAFAVAG